MKKITITIMFMLSTFSNAIAGDSLVLYKEYLSALSSAKSVDDVSEYLSSDVLLAIERSPRMGKEFFEVAKRSAEFLDMEIKEEIKSDDSAVLTYEIVTKSESGVKANPTKVKVTMKREKGLWKIADISFRMVSVI